MFDACNERNYGLMDFTAVTSFIYSFFGALGTWALNGIKWVFCWIPYTIFDGILTAIQSIFGSFSLASLVTSSTLNWAGCPPQAIWLLNQLCLPTCLGMILAALGIRKLIDLIPSWATRF